ncbi:MAG: Type-4 uracil-DNA glycosylase [Arenicellales bacterium IbO2]|nr:MAG: Type-4 uracil-DNA glycosylase [Arenicellales bacterium IbO2]
MQRQTLRRMGVEVWQRRDAPREVAPVAEESSAAPAQPVPAKDAAPAPVQSAPADSPQSNLARIGEEVAACQKCELHKSRTNTVFGCGDARADWMFIGEAPGQNEDLQGLPFVGRAGKLLDEMIAALGMKRERVFIANVLKCRPPGNRDPQPGEVEKCEPYLRRQLEIIRPKVIVALGRISAQALLKSAEPLGRLRGRIYQYGDENIPLVVTYHPAYLLRSPEQKAKAWEDLWQARTVAAAE